MPFSYFPYFSTNAIHHNQRRRTKTIKVRRARTLLKQISRDNFTRKSLEIDKNSVQSIAISGKVVASGSTAPSKIRARWKSIDYLPSLDAFGSTVPTKIQSLEPHTHARSAHIHTRLSHAHTIGFQTRNFSAV